ncbi:MAG: hypothetical protein ISS79_05560 [Phycisphaerae bacterium]|nr:hypothetical protein [Phycisphaerae bacterium]
MKRYTVLGIYFVGGAWRDELFAGRSDRYDGRKQGSKLAKMRVGAGNGGKFLGFLGVILVFELKMGILGGGIGHLVFRNRGKKTA